MPSIHNAMHIRPLSKALQNKAEKELNEIPDQVLDNLEILKTWLHKQNHLKFKDDDQSLINFLRSSKFSIERTKEKLDAYYTFRTLAPEVAPLSDPFDSDIQAALKLGITFPLPIQEEDTASAKIVVVRYPEEYDPEEITLLLMHKIHLLTLDILFNEDDNFVISGVIVIWDLKGIQLTTTLQTDPTLLKKVMHGIEMAYPTRIKAMYILNSPTYFEPVFKLAKRFMSKKLTSRLHFCSTGNYQELHLHVSKMILPNEYGGKAGTIRDLAEKWKKTVESYREKLLDGRNYYSDESKRPGKHHMVDRLFGPEGTFRKLSID